MNPNEFTREIERATRKMVELRRAARAEGGTLWGEAALAELSSTLEELRVAEEELTAQNMELSEAHAAIDFERHRYRELFMSAPFGELVTDIKGVIREGNRAAGVLLGTPAPNLSGKPLPLFVVPQDRDRFSRWVAVLNDASHDLSICAECGGAGEFLIQPLNRNPTFTCEVNAAPLADRLGRIDSVRWCLRDVSDRERAREAERLAEEARRKDEFLAVLGHELRNPLAAITLAADILTSSGGDPARKRWAAEVVQRHADQLRRLVDDLLDVSRVSHGKISLQVGPVDVRDVVSAALESCQGILQGKGHELLVVVPDSPVNVQADGQRLGQVVMNLVDNAAKYTPSGGKIEVTLATSDEGVVLAVKDNGIGIPANMLDRIFSQFEQLDGAAELRVHGLGLGLALVRQLVSLHGGTVSASSPGDGKGSTFRVALPHENGKADPHVTGAPRPLDGEPATERARVLIVDDNADAAKLMAEKLERAGYTVETAFDGKGALALARRTRCAAALIDLGLPDIDGYEVCRTLRDEQPDLCLIALTGYSDSRSREKARDSGFDVFLVKPLDPREVVSALGKLVDLHE